MKSKRLVIVLLVVSCGLAACAARVKNVTGLPPGVTLTQAQDWDAAVADLHKVAATVSTLRQTLTDLHGASYDGKPVLSDEYYADALRAVAHIDLLELSAENVLRQSPQNFSLTAKQQVGAYIQQILTEVEKLNSTGATGIKNPASLDKVNGLLADIAAVIKLVLSL